MSDALPEQPCYSCGVRCGGNLRSHKKDCELIASYCEKFPGIKAFVEGKEMSKWEREGPRKNAKH
jgi:hypothetical protein